MMDVLVLGTVSLYKIRWLQEPPWVAGKLHAAAFLVRLWLVLFIRGCGKLTHGAQL